MDFHAQGLIAQRDMQKAMTEDCIPASEAVKE